MTPSDYALDIWCKEKGYERYNGGDIPIFGFKAFNKIALVISDPEVFYDLFTTVNRFHDKTTIADTVFKKLLGNSFLFSKADDQWKKKRKAMSHAFYKDRLDFITEALKPIIMNKFNQWMEEIDSSTDRSTEIDISTEFEDIFSRNIIKISFGEDVSDEKFEIMVPSEDNENVFVPKMVGIRDALNSIS